MCIFSITQESLFKAYWQCSGRLALIRLIRLEGEINTKSLVFIIEIRFDFLPPAGFTDFLFLSWSNIISTPPLNLSIIQLFCEIHLHFVPSFSEK